MSDRRTRLPRTLDEITPAWLNEALQQRYPGVEASVEVLDTIYGTETKRQFRFHYNDAGIEARLPATMWLKGGLDPGHFDLFADTLVYVTEARFFRDIAPEVERTVRIPRCFYSDYDDRQGLSLIEDLAVPGVEFGRATRPLSVDAIAALSANLARLHAHWWASPQLDAWDWVQMPMQEDTGLEYFRTTSNPQIIAQRLASRRGERVPPEVRNPRAIYESMQKDRAARTAQTALSAARRPAHRQHVPHARRTGIGRLAAGAQGPLGVRLRVLRGFLARHRRAAALRARFAESVSGGAPAQRRRAGDARRGVARLPPLRRLWLHRVAVQSRVLPARDVNIATGERFAVAAADLETFKSFD